MTRGKRLATMGDRGELVRLFEEVRGDVKYHVVQWGQKHARRQESFAGTRAGRLEAEAFMRDFKRELDTADAPAPPLTLRALWDAYRAAEFSHLRPNTRRLYTEAWRHLESHLSPAHVAQDIDVPTIAAFRAALDARLATATVKRTITVCRIVFRWAEVSEVLQRNKWHLYKHKVAKEARTAPRAEYRTDEFARIWLHFDPTKQHQWRPYVAIGLLGLYGNRQTELLAGLQWPNISDDEILIPGAYVKTGDDLHLPLVPLTRELLAVARSWREAEGYAGVHVLFPGQRIGQKVFNGSKRPHYSIQSLTDAIHRAERHAGVPTILYRAGHGFRRGLVGDLADVTGDVALALQAVGDRDIRMAQHYRLRRLDKMRALFADRAQNLSEHRPKGATKVQSSPEKQNAAQDGAASNSQHGNDL